ncbi:venom acid phosphatase Acph-1-like [Maniola hyperantus]|uniref:venom acid phosphatase Acph-1-like n=1 Tax=Aphantopus hyperantus TaxID=2795564 RepID=UPI00156A1F6B|nr:venom acid phosphatase Acph-1-like [Maniola hyperantus]XP_034836617.1 venom acid phosphatase Acph-1-like [Maniola hyperantus]
MLWSVVLVALQCHLLSGHFIKDDHFRDREVVLAFVVNRHGERSPDADELSFSDQQQKILNVTYIEGLEGLTNSGKLTAYQIGKFIKQRYGDAGLKLLSSIYLQDEIAVRSTDKERTKMTALMAMAAVYPPEIPQQWDEGLGKVWQPVPYTAVPLSEDYLRFHSNCKYFKELLQRAKEEASHQEFAQFKDLAIILKKETGRNFTENPLLYQVLFDLFKSQVSLGLDVPQWAKPLLPKLGEAAGLSYRLYFRYDEMKKIGGGVILNDFIDAANDIAAGKQVQKRFRMYSAHDFNIGALMEAAQVLKYEQSLPEYGSLFGLEMYRLKSTGELTVVPFFLPRAGQSTAQNLHITGCEKSNHCDFNKFKAITQEYLLKEREFYNICNIRTEL